MEERSFTSSRVLTYRLRNDICVLYQRMGRSGVVNEVVLDSVGPAHDVNTVEQGVECAGFD